MTSANGYKPEVEHTQPEVEQPPEPVLEAYSLDYWREMTERQIERLRARVRQLEDEAAPLRLQIAALTQALRSTGHAAPEHRPGRGPYKSRAPRLGGDALQTQADMKRAYNHTGEDITAAEVGVLENMARAGKSTSEVRAVLPHVKPGQVYAKVQAAQKRMAKEILRREAAR